MYNIIILSIGRSGHITMQTEGKQSLVLAEHLEALASTVAIWSSRASSGLNPRSSCSNAPSGLLYSSKVL